MVVEKCERGFREEHRAAAGIRVSHVSIVASVTTVATALFICVCAICTGCGQSGSGQPKPVVYASGEVLCGFSCDNVTANGTCVLGAAICPGADAALQCTDADCDSLSEPGPPACPDGTSSVSPCIYLPLMQQNGHCGWGPWICPAPDAASSTIDASAAD